MSERERLIKELKQITSLVGSALHYECIVNFILEDRKRICAPLVNFKQSHNSIQWLARQEDDYAGTDVFCKAIEESLKLASLDTLPEQKGKL